MIKGSSILSKKIGLVTEGIVAFKRNIKITSEDKSEINLIISVGENKEKVLENILKYSKKENIEKAFKLSKAKNEAEARYLGIKGKDVLEYQKILSYILFNNPAKQTNLNKLSKRKYNKKELWKYGISGDLPIILVKIKDVNDSYIINEVLKAYEFIRLKNIEIEVVILDEEKHSYENYVREEVKNSILSNQMGYLKNIRGGIFELSKNEISKEDKELLEFTATIIIDVNKGGIKNNIKDIEEEFLENYKDIACENENIEIATNDNTEDIDLIEEYNNLKYYNGYGAFSEDGKEYIIKINKENRLPTVWSHIMANDKFGTLVTENMGGYTWFKNSRLNRITSWENYPNLDIPSEIIYLKDLDTKKVWSLGLNPMPDNKNYNVIYGFGYCKYIHKSQGVEQNLEIFVPKEDNIKVEILKLKNTTIQRRKFKIIYYIKPTLGEDSLKTEKYLDLQYDKNNNLIQIKNLYNNDFYKDIIYVSSSEKISSYTGDKTFFMGEGNISFPEALEKTKLNNENSIGKRTCLAYEIEVELDSLSEKEIVFVLGAEENEDDVKKIALKYRQIQNCKNELQKIKNHWKDLLGRIQVKTPVESIDIMLNGWVQYQIIQSRLQGRTGYYQSGGALGFRDQLQDTLGLKYIDTNILKNQILKHSKHQFKEGDVEHWWHEENNMGIRTRFTDDLLWLVYLVNEYIEMTNDYKILEEKTNYLEGEKLKEYEIEKYKEYFESNQKGSIYEHCIKAIEKSLDFGENGLPKIGGGDWNDGFSNVGINGIGESVWLGFFLYNILDKFCDILKVIKNINLEIEDDVKEIEEKISKYKMIMTKLKQSLNTKAWDGKWYKRAFMDDGNELGSIKNEECRIDSVAQSWSVISKCGDKGKIRLAMEGLENNLIDKENKIIKLLNPPFENGKLEPGYIKSYLPGVRENGGQYTHAAIWVIIAEAILENKEKTLELYKVINPIEHSKSMEEIKKYKLEPYVIPADIYGIGNLVGRGGWSWYTGAASWYYKAGIEYILGFKIKDNSLIFSPCIPKEWKEYSIKYKWKNSIYNVNITNKSGNDLKIKHIILNGKEVENGIKLKEKGVYNIEIEL